MNEVLRNKISQLPETSGVYLMKNKAGEIIYVGKARVLKNRVGQYFHNTQKYVKVAAMVAQIEDLEYIICDSEMEALVLEANLIRRHRPYYNILLKDDKHFPYVRVDFKEDFPRFEVVRAVKPDGAKYFGPYIAAHVIRDVLDNIYKTYPLRTCKKDIQKALARHERPCLNYAMGRCYAPCAGRISRAEYHAQVQEVADMLGGGQATLRREMKQKMLDASEKRQYEQAAKYRDKLRLIERIAEKQKAGFPNLSDKDVFGAAKGALVSVVQAFLVRDGELSVAQKYWLSEGETESEILSAFLLQYYESSSSVPKMIYVSDEIDDHELIEQWLSDKKGSKVRVIVPARGDHKKLADMAKKNAQDAIKLKETEKKKRVLAMENLKQALQLPVLPSRMECYDISNTQGTDSVASMVVFEEGAPAKKQYRKFKIKTVQGANDFASMSEVLERRLLRALKSTDGFDKLPDLIIVDGGKGQLSAAMDVLYSLGLEELPICGLAKREEEIFLPHRPDPVLLPKNSLELRLMTRIRDEAHRFAITYHRNLREARQSKSVLDSIPGVGEKRKRQLLRAYKSVDAIRRATPEELHEKSGIPKPLAKTVYEYLHTV